MNDELQTYIEPEVEARLMALVLGEASAFEAEELERLIKERPEVRACKERLEKIHGVLAEAHREQDDKKWRLSEKRRAKVLAKVEAKQKEQLEKERTERVRKGLVFRRSLYSLAACLVVGLITVVAYQLGDHVAKDWVVAEASRDSQEQALITRGDGRALYIQAQEDGEARAMEMNGQSELRFARQRLSELEVSRDQLEKEMSNKNPEMRAALQKKMKKADQQIDRLSSVVDERTTHTIDLSLGENQSNQARESYQQSRAMLRELKMNQAEARAQLEAEVRPEVSSAPPSMDVNGIVPRPLSRPERTQGFSDFDEKAGSAQPLSPKSSKAEMAKALAHLEESLPTLGDVPVLRKKARQGFNQPSDTATAALPVTPAAPTDLSEPAPPELPQMRIAGIADSSGGIGGGGGGGAGPELQYKMAALEELKDSKPVAKPVAELEERMPSDGILPGSGDVGKEEPENSIQSLQVAGDELENENDRDSQAVTASSLTNGKEGGLKKNLSRFQLGAELADGEDFGEGLLPGRDTLEKKGGRVLSKTAPAPELKVENRATVAGKEQLKRADSAETGAPQPALEAPAIDLLADIREGKDFLGGGAVGASDDRNNRDFISPVDRVTIPGIPASPQESVRSIVTAGNRSGAAAVTRNRIDALLDESEAVREVTEADEVADDPFAMEDLDGGSAGGDPFAVSEDQVELAQSKFAKEENLKDLDDPIRTSPALSDDDTKQVDEVRRGLYKGDGYYDLGLYDKATEEFKKVLRTDPYNKAARRGMERANAVKSDYYRAAYDQTRAEMLMEVDKAWDLAVPPLEKPQKSPDANDRLPDADSDGLGLGNEIVGKETSQSNKLRQVIIPEVNFEDVTIEEAIKFLETRSRELDTTTLDSEKKGVNLRLVKPRLVDEDGQRPAFSPESDVKIKELKLKNVPLEVALEYVAEAALLRYRVDEDGVTFLPLSAPDEADILQRKWEVSPELKSFLATNGRHDPGVSVKELLMANGVAFHANSSVSYLEKEGVLIVRNTPTQLELMDAIVGAFEEDVKKREAAQKEAAQRRQERENFETSTAQKTDSTFSLNVSDVSFKLAKAALAEGKRPEVTKVRPEEFFNALDYGDERPSQAEKVACAFEQSAHPFLSQRNLMRISMSTASLGRNAATPLRLTLLLDQSGSMERVDRAESVKRAFALLARELTPNDEVTLIGFARPPRLLAERVKGNEAAKLAAIVANPITEGGTNLEEALASGMQLAKQQYLEGAQNRVILLTDGAANLGDARPGTLVRQVQSMRRLNIAFDACGVGADGLNDEILSSLAKEGDGRYYFLDRPEDADEGFARQIAGALRPAASNVKVQVLFNPERVKSFYLYGFEKHRLKKEDFRNDAVDAAEMAAEESGVALYHFEPLPDGRGDIGTVSVRFLDTTSQRMVERTWAIPYESNPTFFEEADPSLRLAGVAGLFAEALRGSPVGERVELKRLRQETETLKPRFGSQTRFQELQTMLRQAGE